MRVLLLSLLLSVGCCEKNLDGSWRSWKREFDKNYSDEKEEVYRRSVWEQKVLEVMKHNEKAEAGHHTFTIGLNHLSDMTAEEINAKMNGLRMENFVPQDDDNFTFPMNFPLPHSVNWTEDGFVSAVQNQGNCNSCWAFSAVGALEAQMKMKKGLLVPLSVQQLVDCSHSEGNRGCLGGLLTNAFHFVVNNQGISKAAEYPYEDKEVYCRRARNYGHCKGYRLLPHYNEFELQKVVATYGPVAVGINANMTTFHQYSSGIYNETSCPSLPLNHAVLIVGYGKDNGKQYWLVKNSWSEKWGEGGYIRMLRNQNQCGIGTYSVIPIV